MEIENNKVVSMDYTLKNSAGEVVDSSETHGEPLEFIIGKNHIIIGLETRIMGMKKGDSKVVVVEAKDAYGEYNEEAIMAYPIEQFSGIELKEGLALHGQAEDGSVTQVLVKAFNDKEVFLDHNHPMAGQELTFDITILDVRDATVDESLSGIVGGAAAAGSCCGGGEHKHEHNNGADGGCCGGGGEQHQEHEHEHNNGADGGCCGGGCH